MILNYVEKFKLLKPNFHRNGLLKTWYMSLKAVCIALLQIKDMTFEFIIDVLKPEIGIRKSLSDRQVFRLQIASKKYVTPTYFNSP